MNRYTIGLTFLADALKKSAVHSAFENIAKDEESPLQALLNRFSPEFLEEIARKAEIRLDPKD
jgi:hypothetical protein